MPGFTAKIARFGAFEVDLTSGELRRNGVLLRLQEQPFQVLGMLLEKPGEVVTRESLRNRLWPSDTFVDFDHSLNTAVNKLREALGDSAANPIFVQTIARRGYRFIAPVQTEDDKIAALPESTAPLASTPLVAPIAGMRQVQVDRTAYHPSLEIPLPRRSLTRWLFALIQIMYLSFYLAALIRLRDVHRIAESFLPGWGATLIVSAVLITAGIGIPLRCFLLSAVSYDHRRLREKFLRLFPLILTLDQFWAAAPFLMMEVIDFGAAFGVCAALLYLPFAERSLIRMAYPEPQS
jgi:DNA-binding winged helix-turn-helix (wHTH) protein